MQYGFFHAYQLCHLLSEFGEAVSVLPGSYYQGDYDNWKDQMGECEVSIP